MDKGPGPSVRIASPSLESEVLRILVIRADRLGDVILSTPVFEVIKRHYPKAHLTVMVQEAVAPLIRGLPSVDEVVIYEPSGAMRVYGYLEPFARDRARKFRIGIVLQTQWRFALAIFLARIRFRIGPSASFIPILFLTVACATPLTGRDARDRLQSPAFTSSRDSRGGAQGARRA